MVLVLNSPYQYLFITKLLPHLADGNVPIERCICHLPFPDGLVQHVRWDVPCLEVLVLFLTRAVDESEQREEEIGNVHNSVIKDVWMAKCIALHFS